MCNTLSVWQGVTCPAEECGKHCEVAVEEKTLGSTTVLKL